METSSNQKTITSIQNKKYTEDLAKILSALNPKETLYNNIRSNNYFFSKRRDLPSETIKSDSTLKDEDLNSLKPNFQNGHNKSLSRTYYFINNKHLSKVEVFYDKTSTKKVSYKIPCKYLDDADDSLNDDEDFDNGSLIKEKECIEDYIEFDESDKLQHNLEINLIDEITDFGNIYKILHIYENLTKNFDNFALFLLKYKENFELIENWFDMANNYSIYDSNGEKLRIYNEHAQIEKNFKINQIHEVIILGFIINLYELIRNNNAVGNACYFNLYNNLKNCIHYSFKNILILLNLIISKIPSAENDQFETLCREILERNKVWLNSILPHNELDCNNKVAGNMLNRSLEKFNNINHELKHTQKVENGIAMENYINADLKNLEYIYYSMKNYDKTNYEQLKNMIYNEYLLGNLVKINLLETNTDSDSDKGETEANKDHHVNLVNDKIYPIKIESQLKVPFLPPLYSEKYKYTLVLDLDETLVHYMEDGDEAYVQVRPFAEFFLNEMAKFYEVIIFTAATEEYADVVLNELDKNKSISFVLYRKHTVQSNETFIKDLFKLGRNLNKTLMIDNVKENFSMQPFNGLHISSFLGDEKDCELNQLLEDLKNLVINKVEDVTEYLQEIQRKMNERYGSK